MQTIIKRGPLLKDRKSVTKEKNKLISIKWQEIYSEQHENISCNSWRYFLSSDISYVTSASHWTRVARIAENSRASLSYIEVIIIVRIGSSTVA